ncbi:unnamed protein product [Vicia faba]|uniref:Uncharacterized protein n=1 Tax=Vicia faba TaxID=3906 RepID=A0AAV0YEW9_VICFA|nr:unnamed protein product [Vicia faba]
MKTFTLQLSISNMVPEPGSDLNHSSPSSSSVASLSSFHFFTLHQQSSMADSGDKDTKGEGTTSGTQATTMISTATQPSAFTQKGKCQVHVGNGQSLHIKTIGVLRKYFLNSFLNLMDSITSLISQCSKLDSPAISTLQILPQSSSNLLPTPPDSGNTLSTMSLSNSQVVPSIREPLSPQPQNLGNTNDQYTPSISPPPDFANTSENYYDNLPITTIDTSLSNFIHSLHPSNPPP